jgi:hypothetical protein
VDQQRAPGIRVYFAQITEGAEQHIMLLFKNNRLRHFVDATLMVAGGLLMWFAPEVGVGVLLLVTGIVIELVGIWFEHAQRD